MHCLLINAMSEFLGQRADSVSPAKSSARRCCSWTRQRTFLGFRLRKPYVLPLLNIDPQVDEEMYMCQCVRVVRVHWYLTTATTISTVSQSQLVPFTVAPSVLGILPLFSSSSRSEANKRCVRSALGCKCSILSVTQNNRAHTTERVCVCLEGAERVAKKKKSVPLCNTISAAQPASSDPSVRRPSPFEVAGSKKNVGPRGGLEVRYGCG